MKVLFITSYVHPSSGASALWRLVEGLEQLEIECIILTGNPGYNNNKIIRPKMNRVIYGQNKFSGMINKIANTTILSLQEKNYLQIIEEVSPDVVNYHWTHGIYYLPLNIMRAISEKVPSVWTMHDMWPITGGCFYSYGCDKYLGMCGRCFQKNGMFKVDLTSSMLRKKRKYFNRINKLNIVSPSLWLKEIILKSTMFKGGVSHIPYGVNTNTFKPIDKSMAKSHLGLDENDDVMLIFAKMNKRKGFDLFSAAISQYFMNAEISKNRKVLLIAGAGSHKYVNFNLPEELKVIPLGYVQNEILLRNIFCATDIFLMPTRADNLPSSILESMACGTPVISFDVGGIGEMVRNGKTGYLAKKEDPSDFMTGIKTMLNNKEYLSNLSNSCRSVVLEEFSIEKQAKKYFNLFNKIIASSRN